MRLRTLLSLVFVIVFALFSFAQVSPDPQDSGYKSPYLKNFSRNNLNSDDPDADNAFLRQEALKQRFGVNPKFVTDVMKQGDEQRALFPQLMPGALSTGGAPQWVSIGPTKSRRIQNGVLLTKVNSGRARTILPHPTNPNIVYFLTSSGGFWKTSNFSAKTPTWRCTTDSIAHTSGGAMAFGRTPNTIYLGLGDPFDGNPAAGGFMLKSIDGGETWGPAVRLEAFGISTGSVRDVKVDNSGPQDIILVATDFGLFRSADGGTTYARANDAVFLYPTQFGTFSQTVWSIQRTSVGWVAAIESPFVAGLANDLLGALVVSTNQGATWQPLATLQANRTDNQGNPIVVKAGRITLGVGAAGDSTVYAYAADQFDNVQLDLFRSSNGGQSWTPIGLNVKTPVNPNPSNPNMNIMQGQAFYNHMLLVDPTDSSRNTVYIGGQRGSAKTTNGGATWAILAEWLGRFHMPYVHADYHAAAFSPLNNTIFFGTDGGVFTSQDGGANWDDRKNEGIVTTLAYSIATGPKYPDISIIGTQDNGTYTRESSGSKTIWNQTLGGDGVGTAWSQANDDVALGSFPGVVIRSLNNPPNIQANWRLAFNGIDLNFGTFFTAYATPTAVADPTGHTFFHYNTQAVYKTTNGAALWQKIGEACIPNAQGTACAVPPSPGIGVNRVFRDTPHGIGVSPTADGRNHVGVACLGGFMVFTHNGGASWIETPLIGTVAGWNGFNSTVEFADNNTIYVGSESPFAGDGRVVKSTDGGVSFTRADSGLPDVPVMRLLVSPADKNTVYAATFLGVYRSTNGGGSWSRFGAGLPMVEVDDMNIVGNGAKLRAATYGRGVWEIALH